METSSSRERLNRLPHQLNGFRRVSFAPPQSENVALCCSSFYSAILFLPLGQTILTLHLNSVPTQDQVLVPETLLKKRKSQEAARAARREEAEKRKQVSYYLC